MKYSISSMVKKTIFILAIYFFSGCTSDSSEDTIIEEVDSKKEIYDLSILSIDNSNVVNQIDVDSENSEVVVENLSESMGIPQNFGRYTILDQTLSFYNSFGNLSIWQRDVKTNQNNIKIDYFDARVAENSFTVFAANSLKNLITIYSNSSRLPFKHFVNVQSLSTGINTVIELGDGEEINRFAKYIVQNEIFIILYQSERGTNSLAVFDLNNLQLNGILNFDSQNPDSVLVSATLNNGLLHIFLRDGTFYTHDVSTLNIIETGSYSSLGFFETGLFNSIFLGDKMLYREAIAQPNPISDLPAIYNFTTETKQTINLFEVRSELMRRGMNFNGIITSYNVDLVKERIYVGYGTFDGIATGGGIAIAKFNGEIMEIRDIGFPPIEIIIK